MLIELVLISAAASALLWLVAWRVTGDARRQLVRVGRLRAVGPVLLPRVGDFSGRARRGDDAAVALLPLVDARAREPRPLFAVGSALAVLPWLSSRFVLLACMAAIVIAGRLVTDRSQRCPRAWRPSRLCRRSARSPSSCFFR